MDNIKKFEDFLDRMQGLLDNAKKQGHIIVRVEDLENAFPELMDSDDKNKPNGGIVMEDFNEGNGFYKVNLAYLNEEQVKKIEELVKKWNPELKESEYERIRKALLEMVHDTTGDELWIDYDVHKEDAIAWLEKQNPVKFNDEKDEMIRKALIDGFTVMKESKNCGKTFSNHNIPVVNILAWLEKQGEQKPQRMVSAEAKEALYDKPKWSEEDEKRVDELLRYFAGLTGVGFSYWNERIIAWLKSLKERMEGK